jgi:cytochrome c oxidase subunit II
MEVRVVGEQFTWTFYYPGEGGREVVSNQLYLPNNTPVRFNVQSKDVIHDFWVPAFRQKIDAVPGITTHYRITTEREGEFPIVCAELCGLGHSVMRQTAHVVPRGEFDRWLAEKRRGGQPGDGGAGGGGAGAPGGGDQPVDGKTLFTQTEPSCGSCHTLADAGTSATIGPNLDETLRGKDADYVRQSIVDPSAEIASGFQDGIMPPNYDETLDPREIDALVDYLVKATSG